MIGLLQGVDLHFTVVDGSIAACFTVCYVGVLMDNAPISRLALLA